MEGRESLCMFVVIESSGPCATREVGNKEIKRNRDLTVSECWELCYLSL